MNTLHTDCMPVERFQADMTELTLCENDTQYIMSLKKKNTLSLVYNAVNWEENTAINGTILITATKDARASASRLPSLVQQSLS